MALILVFHNDGTAVEPHGNYDVSVLINKREIASGRVEDYDRADGWKALVERFLKETVEK